MITEKKRSYRRKTIQQHAKSIGAIKTVDELGAIIGMAPHQLNLLALQPGYRVYEIAKPHGGFRLIEDPEPSLKNCLRRVNHLLQCGYYMVRPPSCYGFTISASDDDSERNIVSNAQRHLGAKYLLNIDMKDFFHQVSEQRVLGIFESSFPRFDSGLSELLCKLTTRLNRLPMGAPTSPVLSNFACIELDAELQKIADGSAITYTRFADDLSFSSANEITDADLKMMLDAITGQRYVVNGKKVKRMGPGDVKSVTGLILGPEVDLPLGFIPQLLQEIERLKSVMLVEQRFRTGMSYKKLKLLKQELSGKINFATMVLGYDSESVQQLQQTYEDALNPPEELLVQSWLDIPYDF